MAGRQRRTGRGLLLRRDISDCRSGSGHLSELYRAHDKLRCNIHTARPLRHTVQALQLHRRTWRQDHHHEHTRRQGLYPSISRRLQIQTASHQQRREDQQPCHSGIPRHAEGQTLQHQIRILHHLF